MIRSSANNANGDTVPGFRAVPRTGVIYVMHRAAERGFFTNRAAWANLGQGAPECGELTGAPRRLTHVEIDDNSSEYAPVGGTLELRERVARFYNEIYARDERSSMYTPEHVSIAPGGRAAMTRLAAALGTVNMGHLIPDYTAYEELLTTFKGFVPIPMLSAMDGTGGLTVDELEREIIGRGLAAVMLSNPCNPTGRLVEGETLRAWIDLARSCPCTMIFDEFYSHYIYTGEGDPRMVSAAEYIDDVDADPVLIVDGLTKNWRYPGLRVSWIVGPRDVIERVNSAGSFLDGGANHPFQVAAADLLDPELARQETRAIQQSFREKRSFMLDALRSLGIKIEAEPHGAFYVWGSLEDLPNGLNDGFRLFEAGLDEHVITVPGKFFDVNPGRRRARSRFESYTRFSFGPSMEELQRGIEALARVIR